MSSTHNSPSSSRPGMIKRMGRGERRRRRKKRIQLAGIAAAFAITITTATILARRELGIADRIAAERLQTVPELETQEVETLPPEQPAQPDGESIETATDTVKPDAFANRTQAVQTGPRDHLALPASLSDEADLLGDLRLPEDQTSYIWSPKIEADKDEIAGPESNRNTQSAGPFVQGAPLAKARAFLEATTLAGKLAHVRNTQAALPLLKEVFADRLAAGESLAMPFRRLSLLGDTQFKGVTKKGGDFHYRNFALTLTDRSQRLLPVVWIEEEGQLAVDVPAFLRSDSDSGFRVLISENDYYNFAYEDEDKWQSFRVSNPDWESHYFAYVKRDSPADYQLRMLLSVDEKDSESRRSNSSEPDAYSSSPDDLFAALFGSSVSAPTQWLDQQDITLLPGSAIRPRQIRNPAGQSARPRTARAIVEIIPGNAGEHPERRQVEIVRFIQKGWVQP